MRRRRPRGGDELGRGWRQLAPLARLLWAVAFCLAVLYAAGGVVRLVA